MPGDRRHPGGDHHVRRRPPVPQPWLACRACHDSARAATGGAWHRRFGDSGRAWCSTKACFDSRAASR